MTLKTNALLLSNAIAAEEGLVLVLTGAGVSLASGIPTFHGKDTGALWAHDVMELATYSYFQRNPVSSWQWYRQRFASVIRAKPNAAHIALAAIERWHVTVAANFPRYTEHRHLARTSGIG